LAFLLDSFEILGLVTVREALRHCDYSQQYLRRLLRNDFLNAKKNGGMWLVKESSLLSRIHGGSKRMDNRYGPKTRNKTKAIMGSEEQTLCW